LLDERGDETQFLDALDLDPGPALDGDVQVLPDRPDPPQDLPRRSQQRAESQGDLAGFLRSLDVRGRRDLHERDAEAIEAVDDLARGLPEFPGCVFLQEDRRNPDAFPLLDGGRIDLAELRLRGPQPSAESESAGRVDEGRRVFAEQLVGRELLVDLQADLQTECAVVQRGWKPGAGIKPSLRAGR